MIEYVFRCDECRREHVEDLSDHASLIRLAMNDHLPSGWSLVRGRLICDDHEVIVKAEENS